jgi:photosystem II stability/assembly factor-like uncharacterized protein
MMHRSSFWLCLVAVCVLSACQKEVVDVPLNARLITARDKFYGVQALSPAKAVVVGYGGKILMTVDGGKTWHGKESGTDLALYDVEFVDEQYGWVCGQDGLILRTTDGGASWVKQESGTKGPIFALSFVDRNHGWGAADRATYLRTTNGGESWESGYLEPSLAGVREEATLAMVDPNFYDIHFLDAHRGWMVGDFGKIYHTVDGGVTWKEQQHSLLGQAGIDDALNLPTFFGVSFANAQEGVVVGLEGKISYTADGGEQWRFIAEEVSAFATDPLYTPLLRSNGTGWIVGAAGRVLQLQNGQWRPVSLGIPVVTWLRAIDFFDDQHGWIVGGYGTILRTTDGGQTWWPSVG